MTVPRLDSWNRLQQITGFPRADLERLAEKAPKHYISRDRCANGTDKWRHIDDPKPALKALQRKLVKFLLRPVPLPDSFCGSVKNRRPVDAIRPHVGQRHVIAMDLRDYFHWTNWQLVYRAWTNQVRCSPDIAHVLTRLTTLNRGLPQGSPTSSYLANLSFVPTGLAIERVCTAAGLRVTFFVDDVLISGLNPTHVLERVIQTLRRHGYGIKGQKLKFMGARDRHTALGIDFTDGISYGSEGLTELRALIENLGSKTGVTMRELASARGKIQHVIGLNRSEGGPLQEFADLTLPKTGISSIAEPKAKWRPCKGHDWTERRRSRRAASRARTVEGAAAPQTSERHHADPLGLRNPASPEPAPVASVSASAAPWTSCPSPNPR